MLAPGHLYANDVSNLLELRKKLKAVTREFQARIGNHQSQLAAQLKISQQTVYSWFKLGRISPWGAQAIGKLYPEFPRERLRPDIINWKSIKLRTPGRRY